MPKQFLGRYAKITVLLKTMVQEVFHYRRSAVWYWWTVVLNDAKKSGHGIEKVVWGLSLEKFNHGTAYAPETSIEWYN